MDRRDVIVLSSDEESGSVLFKIPVKELNRTLHGLTEVI